MTTPNWAKLDTDMSYCICGAVKGPVKIKYDKVVNGVYLAKMLKGNFIQLFNNMYLIYYWFILFFPDEAPSEDNMVQTVSDTHDIKPEDTGPIIVDVATVNEIQLSWQASPTKSDSLRYMIQQKKARGNTWITIDTFKMGDIPGKGIAATFKPEDYKMKQRYQYRVVPIIGASKGRWKTSAVVTINRKICSKYLPNNISKLKLLQIFFLSYVVLPGKPENFRYDVAAKSLLWEEPKNSERSQIQGYLLSWRKAGSTEWKKVRNGGAIPASACHFFTTELLEYRVQAEGADGMGKWSKPVSVYGKGILNDYYIFYIS